MGFAANEFVNFTQCGRGQAVNESPFTYTNTSSVNEIIKSVTVPLGTGADGARFRSSSGNWHTGNGQAFSMYLTVGSLTSNPSNTVTVTNAVPDDGNGGINAAYLQNYTFTFSNLVVGAGQTLVFYAPCLDTLSTEWIYCANNAGVTGHVIAQTHTVSFNANGGMGAPASQTKVYGSVLTLTTSKPTRPGYQFLHWNTSPDETGHIYQPGGQYGYDNDVVLYAIWRQLPIYTVTYDANGGTNEPANQTKIQGTSVTLSTAIPTKSFTVTYDPNKGSVSPGSKNVSCIFKEWNTKSDCSGTSYHPGSTYSLDENVTLYAIWENGVIGDLPTPSRADCQFDSWTTELNGTSTVSSAYVVQFNVTIYAKWKYGITFNGNGGIVTITENEQVTQQSEITVYKTHGNPFVISYNYSAYLVESADASTSASGYTPPSSKQFKGWSRSPSSSSIDYRPGDSYTADEPVTLYAVYDINTYTVTFTDGYRGAVLARYNNVPHGGSVTPPPDPVREGFTFSGWIGNYSYVIADTIITAFWGFTPIWIRQSNKWIKYEPKENK